VRERKLKHRYGLTQAQYDEILAEQGGGCAICGKTETDSTGRPLSVDHNHRTNEVRGLLCGNCNRALGLFQDDITLLRRAITYLNYHNNKL
jgi:hypothetical protein